METVVKAFIRADEEGTYVAECYNLPVATQGPSLDEAARNLQEAVALVLADSDFTTLGFGSETPPLMITLELPIVHAA